MNISQRFRFLYREDFDAVVEIDEKVFSQARPDVDWNDWQLIRFFSANGFGPAKTVNPELNID
ncbi:MAG: hypothetical protein GQ571_01485 [Desulfobacterales bacterium]|nr:hypothetical protein [Desulfobacterales bacterium]